MATRNENPAPFMAVHPGMMIKPELEDTKVPDPFVSSKKRNK
jgi:hypothetical protein